MATDISCFPAQQIVPCLYRNQDSSLLLWIKTCFKHISFRLTKPAHQSWARKGCFLCAESNAEFCSQGRTDPAVPWPALAREAGPAFPLTRAASWAGLSFIWVGAEMTHMPQGCPRVAPRVGRRGAPQVELHVPHWHRLGQDQAGSHQLSALILPPCQLQGARSYLVWHGACQGKSNLGKMLNPIWNYQMSLCWCCALCHGAEALLTLYQGPL